MAEINLANVPITPYDQFDNNDKFIIINDGSTQQLSRTDFLRWIRENVKGEKGDQGVAGQDGKDGTNGTNGISATHSWSGTTLTIVSASGTSSANLKGEKGAIGSNGTNGNSAWTATLATQVVDENKTVLKVINWTGGTGTKPAINQYLSDTGFTTTLANASNIKGVKGDKGDKGATGEDGVKGDKGEKGTDGLGVTKVEYGDNNQIKVTMSDNSEVISGEPVSHGFFISKDTQYTDASKLEITTTTVTPVPNNSGKVINRQPTTLATPYNKDTMRLMFDKPTTSYVFRLRFNYETSAVGESSGIVISSDDDVLEYSRYFSFSPNEDAFDVTTLLCAEDEYLEKGLKVLLLNTSPIKIWDIEYTITRVS